MSAPRLLDRKRIAAELGERRDAARRCICPSHASNRGECPVHDAWGRARAEARDA